MTFRSFSRPVIELALLDVTRSNARARALIGRRIDGGEGGGVVNDNPDMADAGVVRFGRKCDVDACLRGAG